MNPDMQSERHAANEQSAYAVEGEGGLPDLQKNAPEHFTEDENLFVSELGWLAVASVTIASVAAGVGLG